MALWDDIRPQVLRAEPATVRGQLVWHIGGEWPLLLTGDDTVRGDLLALAPGTMVNGILVDEELRYGYDARWLPVTLDNGTETEALVFVWPRRDEVGAPISGGDYVAEVRTRSGRL